MSQQIVITLMPSIDPRQPPSLDVAVPEGMDGVDLIWVLGQVQQLAVNQMLQAREALRVQEHMRRLAAGQRS